MILTQFKNVILKDNIIWVEWMARKRRVSWEIQQITNIIIIAVLFYFYYTVIPLIVDTMEGDVVSVWAIGLAVLTYIIGGKGMMKYLR